MTPINVTNRFLSDITWLHPSACSFTIGNHIDVWSVAANPELPVTDDILEVLSLDELARADRFYQKKDRNRFIISRWALRSIIGKYLGKQPKAVEFEAGKNKKPHIKNDRINLHYNMSHSGGHVLIAVTNSAIGVDIEFINNDFGYSEVLAYNFSADEIQYIKEVDHISRFFKLWTRKEAITKATAQGLDCDLRLLPGLDGAYKVQAGIIASVDDWVINSFNINGRYAASIANRPLARNISFYSYPSP